MVFPVLCFFFTASLSLATAIVQGEARDKVKQGYKVSSPWYNSEMRSTILPWAP